MERHKHAESLDTVNLGKDTPVKNVLTKKTKNLSSWVQPKLSVKYERTFTQSKEI